MRQREQQIRHPHGRLLIQRLTVIVAVVAVVLAAVALIPGEKRVVRGLLEDKSSARLKELATERLGGAPDGVIYPFLAEQLTSREWADPRVFDGILKIATEAEDPAVQFASLQEVDIPAAQKAAVALTLALSADQANTTAPLEFLDVLAREMHAYAVETMPVRSDAVLIAAQLYRRADRTELAFQALQDLVRASGIQSLSAHAKEIYRVVALETGHPATAFSVAQDLWESAVRDGGPAQLCGGVLDDALDSYLKSAQASGNAAAAVPVLEGRLAENSILTGALAPATGAGIREKVEFEKYGVILAQYCEWSSLPNRAFDVYGRLALMGNETARHRCRKLQPGLFRREELTEILLQNEPSLALEEIEELAALLGAAGRVSEAERLYRRLIAAHPERRSEFQTSLGLLMDEKGCFDDALNLLRTAYGSDPESAAGPALGRVLVSSGRFQQALDHYREMPQHGRDSADTYAHVATALGDNDSAIAALKLRQARSAPPLVPDFVELAEACMTAGRIEEAEAAFRSGLQQYPMSRELHLRLVGMLGSVGRDHEALEMLLRRKENADDPSALGRLVDLEIETEDYPRVFEWLGGEGVERRVAFSSAIKALVSDICLETGRLELALSLIADLPDEPRFAGTRARALFLNGRYADAERVQAAYVGGDGRTLPDAWRQLGRIRRAMGNEQSARECFGMALALVSKSLVAASANGHALESNSTHGQ